MGKNYDNLPEEIRWDRSWCIAGPDENGDLKAPYAPSLRNTFNISPTDKTYWSDLETAIEAAARHGYGIGFLLSKEDCYTCIDLDVKNEHNYPTRMDKNGKAVEWTTPEQLARYQQIIQAFDSYTERSASGQGYHIWIRGKIGDGCKRDGVEVYSQERFIVCTGDVIVDKEIEERQELLDILVAEIRNGQTQKVELIDIEATESDDTILERAKSADNAEKFEKLFSGDWSGYPSQSEADLALLSIFTFYSKSNTQCRRLFRMSGLGQRAKATKNDRYLNDTLRVIRGREQREDQLDDIGRAATEALMAKLQQETNVTEGVFKFPDELPSDEDNHTPLVEAEEGEPSSLTWPPGTVGDIAKYIFANAPRPVKEVAIVSALGFMAGVCGKAYTIPQSGLNLYLVLVARSAIGKEAMHSGMSSLLGFIANSVPAAMQFADFKDYASGPALQKAVAANTSFVNVTGEWGRKLKRLAIEDGRDGPMQSLRTQMTHLYQKSASTSIVGGIGYSDGDKNVGSVSGVAYSMIGETTPNTFYESLTESMMEDGFLSRFTIIEYLGERPPSNIKEIEPPHPVLLDSLCELVARVVGLNQNSKSQPVACDEESNAILKAFDKECDGHINSSEDEGFRQMWNRAHLKAYRLAALLSVGDNIVSPMIKRVHVDWAIDLIRKDIKIMNRRIQSGDIGVGDSSREKKLLSLIGKYMKNGPSSGYGIPSIMHKDGIVPRRYFYISQRRTYCSAGCCN
jgi:hypothetical protein